MPEIHSIALQEFNGPKPKHGRGGNSTRSLKPICGAKTRAGGGHPCRRMAGHGTSHLGMGRCKYHGGSTPIKHGLYSKVVPAAMQESYHMALENPDPKSMREHIALIDGVILPGALKRGFKRLGTPGLPDPLETQLRAIDTKSKVLKRISDIEDRDKIKMTEADLKLFALEVVSVVSEFVDAQTLRKIADRFGVRANRLEIS